MSQANKMKNRLKNRYIQTIGVTVIVLALVRCIFPGVAEQEQTMETAAVQDSLKKDSTKTKTAYVDVKPADVKPIEKPVDVKPADVKPIPQKIMHTQYVSDGAKYHRIISVPSYATAFPDSNHVQMPAAQYWGVSPVKNRQDAEARKSELVYVGSSPYYELAKLDASIPYLVPRAALLLQDIGQNFMDSLQVKGVPLRRIIVSSVLRTEEDVARLRKSNKNATEQSCHLYGTTFDINYNLFSVVTDPDGPKRDDVMEIRLKQILSEVLNDLRNQGRCYVKHESRQPCFHITVR